MILLRHHDALRLENYRFQETVQRRSVRSITYHVSLQNSPIIIVNNKNSEEKLAILKNLLYNILVTNILPNNYDFSTSTNTKEDMDVLPHQLSDVLLSPLLLTSQSPLNQYGGKNSLIRIYSGNLDNYIQESYRYLYRRRKRPTEHPRYYRYNDGLHARILSRTSHLLLFFL